MTKEINSLVLAYLGDTIYEDYIREYLIKKGIASIKELQEASMDYVSAKSQARILEELINKNIFNEEELEIIKRARNNSSKHHPKSCDVITYRKATGLESLIGYLKLEGNIDRIEEIMKVILYEI
jgi:ribonuclease-3 family protein